MIMAKKTKDTEAASTALIASTHTEHAQTYLAEAAEIYKDVQSFQITTQEECLHAQQVGQAVVTRVKEIKAWRDAVTKPIKEGLALFNDPLNDGIKKLEAVASALRQRIAEFEAAEQAKREAAALEAAANDDLDLRELVASSAEGPARVEGVGSRAQWGGEVTDMAALLKAIVEGKAPITFVEPNTAAINAFARATKGSQEVPGVAFGEKKIISFGKAS
jgi:hypothetical protein